MNLESWRFGKGRNTDKVSYLPTHMTWMFLIYMLVQENDVEKNVILLYLVVQYHYCFMSGTVTALCCLATAY